MKRFILFTLIILVYSNIFPQSGKTYYVTPNILNLRSQPSTNADVVDKLQKHQNVIFVKESEINGWVKVKVNDKEGFVSEQFIKKGKCVVSTNFVRTGAKCKDGTTSSATGRGACSHHGGVAYWLTTTKKSVNVIQD